MVDLTNSSAVEQKRLDAIEYLTDHPHLTMIYNSQRIDITKFGNETIVSESVTVNRQFDSRKNSWVATWFTQEHIEDSTSLINLGFNKVAREACHLIMGSNFPSAWTSYPTQYKFIGVQINV